MSAEDPHTSAVLQLLGISHRTAPIETLEGVSLSGREVDDFYGRVHAEASVDGAMVLSTCNRTEVYFLARHSSDATARVASVLQDVVGTQRLPAAAHFYEKSGSAALEHLCRVASGLDSMVLGEAQILGQVREAFERALEAQRLSPYFEEAVQHALRVAARSRAETEIGRGAVSVASAAVHLASRIYSDLTRHSVAVVGAGETGRLVAERFAGQQPAKLYVLNRTQARAEQLAREVGGDPTPWEELPAVLSQVDVAAVAVRSDEPVLGHDTVSDALARHPKGAVALLDLGLPRNVDPAVGKLTNVFLYDLEALRQVVDGNLARRRKEVPHVEAIVEEELDKFSERQAGLRAGPLITALRQSVEELRRSEVDRLCRDLSPQERQRIDRVTKAVVNKLLHGPTVSIKEYSREDDRERLQVVRDVFRNLKM